MSLSIIVAHNESRLIGIGSDIPWHNPEIREQLGDTVAQDLVFFKQKTLDASVIMGRKTFNSIGRLLPKRKNIVISRQLDYSLNHSGITVVPSLKMAIEASDENGFVIGGGEVYSLALPFIETIYRTIIVCPVSDERKGIFFPELGNEWRVVKTTLLSHGRIEKLTRV